MTLRFGYGTNGFGSHRLEDALTVIAGLGYDGVALTLDHPHLDPFDAGLAARTAKVGRQLDEFGLAVVIETGARYVLDPWRKHEPTLVSAGDRAPRVELLRRAVQVAADLGAEAVSFWSGTLPSGTDADTGWRRLTAGVAQVLAAAEPLGMTCAFEPEPGMFVDTLDAALELRHRLGSALAEDHPRPRPLRGRRGRANRPGRPTRGRAVGQRPGRRHAPRRPRAPRVRRRRTRPAGRARCAAGHRLRRARVGGAAQARACGASGGRTVAGGTAFGPAPGSGGCQMTTLDTVDPRASAALEPAARERLETLCAQLAGDPIQIRVLMPAAARLVGRGPLDPADPQGLVGPTLDDAVRGALLVTLAGALAAGHGSPRGRDTRPLSVRRRRRETCGAARSAPFDPGAGLP